MNKDRFIQDYLTTQRWAMRRTTLNLLCGIVERHIAGQKATDEQIRMAVSNRKPEEKEDRKYTVRTDGKAVLSITGVIAKYSSMVNDVSQPQGTSIEFLSEQLDLMIQDNRVKCIFLRFESPGGIWSGQPDFVDKLWKASFVKPIISFADDIAVSAAYYLASQGNVFIANQSAEVGSIGVYMVVPDYSKAAEMEGVKFNIVASGPNKGAGYPGSEVTDEQLAVFRDSIDADYEMFLRGVLRGRAAAGLSEETLRQLADGRVYAAAAAVENKLIDGILTLEAALAMDVPAVRDEQEYRAAASAEKTIYDRKDTGMEKEKKDQAASPDAAAENKIPAAVDQERSRILSIQSALTGPEFKATSDKAIAEGMDLTQAKALAFDISQTQREAESKASAAKIAEMQTRLDAIAKSGHQEDLKSQPDGSAANPLKRESAQDGSAEAFDAAVDTLIKSGQTRANAIAKAARQNPRDHQAWVASKQKK